MDNLSALMKHIKETTPPNEPEIGYMLDRLKELRKVTKGIALLDTVHVRAGLELIIIELRELADCIEKEITAIREWETKDYDKPD